MSVCHGEDLCPVKTVCVCGVLSIGCREPVCCAAPHFVRHTVLCGENLCVVGDCAVGAVCVL